MTVAAIVPGTEAPAEAPQADAPASERPSWLPGKFANPEALAAAYGELEKKVGQPAAQSADLDPSVTPEKLGELMKDKGLDLQTFVAEHAKDGKLGEESLKALEEKGFTRKFVGDFITGQEAAVAAQTEALFKPIGGKAEFDKAASWAKTALSPAELKSFNDLVSGKDLGAVGLAVQGLYARFTAANPREPGLVQGTNSPADSQGFQSTAQVVTAMRDPRYKTDPAYRAEVERKMSSSKVFGL